MRWTLAAIALSLAGAMLVIAPVLASPTDTIVGGWIHPDCLGNHWLLEWVTDQVLHGRSLVHNDRYYWPIGDSPWLAGNGSDGFLYLPWHLLLGWPMASTAHTLTILTLDGVGAYALARAAGASRPASLAAAPTAAMMVYASQELGAGRFTQVDFGFLAFFLASWLRLLDAPSAKRAVLSGVLLAATSVLYWYYGFFGVMAGGLLLLARGRALKSAALWKALGVFAVSYLVLVAPVLWVFVRHYGDIPGTAEDNLFPHPECLADSCWPWSAGSILQPDTIPFMVHGGRHSGRALPISTAILGFIGLRARKDAVGRGLALVALLFVLLMAGPLFPHGPFELIYGLAGPLRRFWWPYRHVVVLNLVWITLAALAVDRLLARPAIQARFGPKAATAIGVVLALSIPAQLEAAGAPYRALFSEAKVPVPFYQEVGKLPGDVLIEPPLSPDLAASQAPLMYQLDHHKTLLNGHALWVERVRPDEWDRFVDGNTFLFSMRRLERGEITDGVFRFHTEDLQSLLDRGVRTVTLNREYFPVKYPEVTTAYAAVFTTLFGEPAVKSGSKAAAWDMGRWNGATEAPFAAFDWPKAITHGGPTLPTQAASAPSLGFSMPQPPKPPKRKE